MQITETRRKEQSPRQAHSGWWLLPSYVAGAPIWGMVLVALLG